MRIRQETSDDYLEIYKMVKKSFATTSDCDGDEQDYLNELREKDSFIPELSLVAETDSGELIGQIVLSKMEIKTKKTTLSELLLSPISVHPNYFRKGIARALIERSIIEAKQLGYSAIFLCGNPNLYSRIGFRPTYEYGIFHINDKDKKAIWCMVREIQNDFLKDIEGFVDIV